MIIVINAGSSSIKVALFQPDLTEVMAGQVSGIGGPLAHIELGKDDNGIVAPDHDTALKAILDSLSAQGIRTEHLTAAAHRVVHGGTTLIAPSRITDDVIAGITAAIPLAPLHNPNNLAGIYACRPWHLSCHSLRPLEPHSMHPILRYRPPMQSPKMIGLWAFAGMGSTGCLTHGS